MAHNEELGSMGEELDTGRREAVDVELGEAPSFVVVRSPKGDKISLGILHGYELEEPREATERDRVPQQNVNDFNWATQFLGHHENHLHRYVSLQRMILERRIRLFLLLVILDIFATGIIGIMTTLNVDFSDKDNFLIYGIFLGYSIINIINNLFGIIAVMRRLIFLLNIFIFLSLGLLGYAMFAAFSPLIFFHIGIFLLAMQIRIQISRLASLPQEND